MGLCWAEEVFSTERVDIQNAVLQELRMAFSGTATGGSTESHTPACEMPGTVLPANAAPIPDPGEVAPGPLVAPQNFRAQIRNSAQEQLRAKLPQRYADIVVQADAIADDTVGVELLPPETDRAEVCGTSLSRLLETFRVRERNVPAFVRGRKGVAGDDLLLVQDVLIRSVLLPPGVREAIEGKVQQKQAMLGFRYRVSQELLESLRKEAEGLGISAFQAATGPGGVSADYLRWQGIAATAGSPPRPTPRSWSSAARTGCRSS